MRRKRQDGQTQHRQVDYDDRRRRRRLHRRGSGTAESAGHSSEEDDDDDDDDDDDATTTTRATTRRDVELDCRKPDQFADNVARRADAVEPEFRTPVCSLSASE